MEAQGEELDVVVQHGKEIQAMGTKPNTLKKSWYWFVVHVCKSLYSVQKSIKSCKD